MPASPKKQKPPRKQVNIGFDPADYERIQAAAAEELTLLSSSAMPPSPPWTRQTT